MTVGLVMIVKNEEKTLPRLAESLRGQIDHWTVVDTGSTDSTKEVAAEAFSYVEGQVVEHLFNGFGPSRNVALKAAPACDWLLHMDADETFHGSFSLVLSHRYGVNVNCIEAEQRHGDLRFWLPRLIRGPGWRWEGRAHEYLTNPERPEGLHYRTPGFYVEHHADGGSRGDKFVREQALLMEDWNEQPNARTAFYLGRLYQDEDQLSGAMKWYRRRLAMPGWDQETFYARYSLGLCLAKADLIEEACGQLWLAWGQMPTRAEPLVALAALYRQSGEWTLAWQAASAAQEYGVMDSHGLFSDSTMDWRVPFEISIAAYYTGHHALGAAAQKLLEGQDLPEPYQSAVRSNRMFYQ